MSAATVAVTALLVDQLAFLDGQADRTPSETALFDLLWPLVPDLIQIRRTATAEMQALAPALLARAG